MRDTTLDVLHNTLVELPSEVAVGLLNRSDLDSIRPSMIGTQHRVRGPGAIAAARSNVERAVVVAGRTDDVAVQHALIDLSEQDGFDRVLPSLADSPLVTDRSVLHRLHDRFFRDNVGVPVAGLIDRIDVSYALDWMDRADAFVRYPVDRLARRVADDACTLGMVEPLDRFVRRCDAVLNAQSGYTDATCRLTGALSTVGMVLAQHGASQLVGTLVDQCGTRARWCIAIAAWSHVGVVDETLARVVFSVIDVDAFVASCRAAEASDRGGPVPQYPQALERAGQGYTDDALRLVAAHWPGLLLERLGVVTNDDPQRALLVELALESQRVDLAERLVHRTWDPDPNRKGPLVDADGYRRAVENLRHGAGTTARRGVSGTVAVSYIPDGASVDDVLVAWNGQHIDDIVGTLADAARSHWHVWRPDRASFERLLDACPVRELSQAIWSPLAVYHGDGGQVDPSARRAARVYLDALVARVPVTQVLDAPGGATYLACRLTERFGDDTDRWMLGWDLANRSTRSIDEVLHAAAKLA